MLAIFSAFSALVNRPVLLVVLYYERLRRFPKQAARPPSVIADGKLI